MYFTLKLKTATDKGLVKPNNQLYIYGVWYNYTQKGEWITFGAYHSNATEQELLSLGITEYLKTKER